MQNYNCNKFYGPHREVNVLTRKFKNTCTKDSVRDALSENGRDIQPSWLTSTKESYKGKDIERFRNESKTCNTSRDTTNFVLGFDQTNYITTNQDFKPCYIEKQIPCKGDTKTHIADFCPGNTKSNDHTEYEISFDSNSQHPKPVPQTLEERRKHTNDLRETHFKLGDFSNHPRTETMDSYNKDRPAPDSTNHSKALETYSSCIFRPGDWNRVKRSLVSSGVTQRDFISHPKDVYKSNDNKASADTTYHRATHFSLGNTPIKTTSVYHKDFVLSPKGKLTQHRPTTVRPPSSKLFMSDESADFITTQAANFEDKTRELVLSIRNDRIASLEEVKKRHAEVSVPFNSKQESSCPVESKVLSMTSSDFYQNPFDASRIIQHGPFTNHYNHLSSNYKNKNLSEAKERFKSHDHVSKILRNDCQIRRQDNKSTHFVFGTDGVDDKRSEQSSQYRNHLPVDPSLRSAGKSLPQKNVYSHVYPCLNAPLDPSIPSQKPISVMKKEYTRNDLSLANICPKRKATSNPVVDTHFFHLDNHYSAGTQSSTTKTDFMAPASPFKVLPAIET